MKTIDFKISLKHIKPPIWRRIRMSSAASLLDLHFVIQHSFGWTNSHLFIIKIGSMEFVYPPHWKEDAFKFQSAELAILDELIPKAISTGKKFSYVYDMGDNWQHEILIEAIEDTRKPFEKFGLIEVVKTKDDDFDFDFVFYYTYVIMTNYGKRLMKFFS